MKFNPQYELIIGRPDQTNNYIIPKYLVSDEVLSQGANGIGPDGFRYSVSPSGISVKSGDYLDYNTIPAVFYSIKDLQLTARVTENVEGGTKTSFQVTNLPDSIVNFIRKDDFVCWRASYLTEVGEGEDLPDIYIGQVQKVTTVFPDLDRITTIDCGAGQTIKKNSRISYTWPPGTTREGVIRGILKLLQGQGLPVGTFTMPDESTKAYSILKSPYMSGYSVQGNTLEELHKVLSASKMVGYISKGRYHIQPFAIGLHKLTRTPTDLLFNISASQVKGIPQPVGGDDSAGPSAGSNDASQSNISVALYFNSKIGLESIIRLDGTLGEYEGDYKITSLVHTYDHRGGRYETALVLVGVASE